MEANFGSFLFIFGLSIALKGNAVRLFEGFSSNQDTSQAQTALRAYQDGCRRKFEPAARAFFGRRKKYIRARRILYCAKYLLFGVFRAF